MPVVVVALSFTVVAACDDDGGTNAGATLDAAEAQAIVDGIFDAIEGNDAAESLDGLSDFITGITSLQGAPPLRAVSPPSRIPTALLGATCTWDTLAEGYEDNQSRRGEGPADAIRFALYTISPQTFLPARPLDEIGTIDIWDFTVGEMIDVQHEAAVGGVTMLDYDVSGMLGDVDFDLMTAGLVSDGTVTAYFTHQAEGVSGVTTLLYLDVTSGTFQLGWNYAPGGTGGWTSEAYVRDTGSGASIEYLIEFDETFVASAASGVRFSGVKVADIVGTGGGFFDIVALEGSGLVDADVVDLINLHQTLETGASVGLGLLFFGLENAGRSLPIF